MKINLQLLRIYLVKIYPRYNLTSIIKVLVHRVNTCHCKPITPGCHVFGFNQDLEFKLLIG